MKRKYTSLLLACLMLSAQAWAELTQIDGVYQIGTAQDLADFATLVNGGEYSVNAVLTADINMSGVTMSPIGTNTNRYKGTFDGQNHKISNLTIDLSDTQGVGLFNTDGGVVLKNFYLDNTCSITGASRVGLIGNHEGVGTFQKLGNAASISASGDAGGLIGRAYPSGTKVVNISDCWTTCSMTNTTSNNATFIGWASTGVYNLDHCWTIADLKGKNGGNDKYCARFGGTLNFTNCYSSGGTQIPTESNFCSIGTGAQLQWFSIFINNGPASTATAVAKLTANIDMDGLTIQPIGSSSKRFVGTFDGQGHTISNLTITQEAANTGLFNTGANVLLHDFYLDETCTITGQKQTGVIGQHIGKNGQFFKIGSAATIRSTDENTGGLIGGCWCGSSSSDKGTVTISSCWTIGAIKPSGTSQDKSAQFVGWSNWGTVSFEDCWSIATLDHWTPGYTWARTGGTLSFTNCYSYCTRGLQANVTGVTASDVASGRLCFLLNKGETTTPTWYQTIGTDAVPTLNNTHGTVYAKGNFDCDGVTLTAGELGYANEATAGMTGAKTREHNYVAGVCTQCGQTEANANVYAISTADQFRHFAYGVEAGNYSNDATLANDIDLSGLALSLPMIGSNGSYYSGTFDGQGHAIHNFSLTSTENYAGLFSYLNGGTVKNFSIDGNMTLSGAYAGGIIGQTTSVCTVSDIHSTVNITATGSANDRLGGIIGYANGSRTTLTDCTYGGTITLPTSFTQSAGGIIGGGYNNLNIDNCVFYGTVKAIGSGTKTNFGGMIGYLNSTNMDHMTYCISAGTIELASGRTLTNCNALIASRTKDQTAAIGLTDCYWTDLGLPSVVTKALPDGTTGTSTQITADKAARGELAWMLNGESSDGTWTQTLGVQAAPLPISTGDKVYQFATSGENQYFVNNEAVPVVPLMTLTDAANYTANGAFTATSLTYNRTLAAGGYHSLCLPFAINSDMLSEKGGKLFTLGGKSDEYVTLEETTSVAAGVPCFASVTSDFNFNTLDLKNVPMKSGVTNGTNLKGTFTEITGAGAEGVYKLSGDGTYFGLTDNSGAAVIKPFRSYIAAPAGVKTLNILLSDGTSLTPTLSEEKEAVIYDLAGRRVTKATKGIYIVNGKKVMK